MIVDSQTFDLGRIFQQSLQRGGNGIILVNLFNDKLMNQRSDWANMMDSYEQELKDLVAGLNVTLQGLPQE